MGWIAWSSVIITTGALLALAQVRGEGVAWQAILFALVLLAAVSAGLDAHGRKYKR